MDSLSIITNMNSDMSINDKVWAIYHHPETFAKQSGFKVLIKQLDCHIIEYGLTWEKLQQKSWMAGTLLRKMGNWYYGSAWNALVPIYDEYILRKKLPVAGPFLAHFIWGEFASLSRRSWIRRRKGKILGTFHCSARRQASVLANWRTFKEYDHIVLVSESQREHFESHGFPKEKTHIIHHGINIDYFKPNMSTVPIEKRPLQALMVGSTERDHVFLSSLWKTLPEGRFKLNIYTQPIFHHLYSGIPGVEIKHAVTDHELLNAYQIADLMVIPMLDCTANNAILESMSCGTPVMVNRVGGINEYVDSRCNYVMDNKCIDAWRSKLLYLEKNRKELCEQREMVRKWAEKFSWNSVADAYKKLYLTVLELN